ncbi:MAG: HAMP domain-containing protein [Pegethrix bostrychoides GSE-TBD4-15B]|jgi:C4-dicarboxylate-specific signal transduction histidine kinase|uniref:histidine kinase n=1 Tax=Pegethrix bostrychoides GSE-TBD4-15B TaxID=2839662 RepID=A0A951PA61_9CYAN|nr:HAMP domain-containing protein [Pegethrix bostrychoides GSE-TBD4-15B]
MTKRLLSNPAICLPQTRRQRLGRMSLRKVLILPFVLQIVGTVGLVGYLSFRNGQQTVNQLAYQLMQKSSSLVEQHLDEYLGVPHQINQVNLDAVELGLLDLQNFQKMGQFFFRQMQVFNVGYINFANPTGEFIGVERLENSQYLINETLRSDLGQLSIYSTDPKGNRLSSTIEEDQPPIQDEAWYADAVAAKRPVWSQIYSWDDKPEVMSISSSYPVYGRNQQLLGVMGVDLLISNIGEFLQSIKSSPATRIFIVERSGAIVAASSGTPYAIVNGEAQRLSATESEDPIVQMIARQIQADFGGFQAIQKPQKLSLQLEGEREFVQIAPWQDDFGLSWLVVVAVPEADFMAQINHNTRVTILLCLAALLSAILVGIATARWVSDPILRLNRAAKEITAGNLDQTIHLRRIDELTDLANSFNGMAAQLRASFAELAATNRQLEQRVAERTADLNAKNSQLTQALQELQTTQTELIQSEKMAALGQLVAGIAHEVNTPLGAIQASIGNISAALESSTQQLPKLFQLLPPERLADFFALLELAQQPREMLSFREERQLRRSLKQALSERSIQNAEAIADSFSKMGISPDLDAMLPLLALAENRFVIETAYQLSIVQNNSQNIMLAVERATKIVFALKNYARQDSSGQKFEAAVTDGIDTVLTLYQNQLKRGVQLQKRYAAVPKVLCYAEELTQVWSNLIHNALQAMDGQGLLEITVTQQEQQILVQITDSGGGIPADIQNRIFDPFFTTKPMGEGTGLGLDIVRRIVAKHQGRVELQSQAGHTTFSVWLPIESAPAASELPISAV